jgi:hypothetical protein
MRGNGKLWQFVAAFRTEKDDTLSVLSCTVLARLENFEPHLIPQR